MRRLAVFLSALLLGGAVRAQVGPQFTLRIDGPCGEMIPGRPGAAYDDGSGGRGLFFDPEIFRTSFEEVPNDLPGHTWDVVLTTSENPSTEQGAQSWSWSVGVEGALDIVDVTTNGSILCHGFIVRPPPRGTSCAGKPTGFEVVELTGPGREGPQLPENRGAVGVAILDERGLPYLPASAETSSVIIARIRIAGTFPADDGSSASGRAFFAPRTGSGMEVSNLVGFMGSSFGVASEPPLLLENCGVTLHATRAPFFVRCDANDDGRLDVSDVIRVLSELFRGGAPAACPAAADCDGDGDRNVTDAIYSLDYQFGDGPPPPPPFPSCDFVGDLAEEDCPIESTRCE